MKYISSKINLIVYTGKFNVILYFRVIAKILPCYYDLQPQINVK